MQRTKIKFLACCVWCLVYVYTVFVYVYTYIPGVSALSHRLQSRSDAAVRAVAKTPIDASNCGPAARLKQNISKQDQNKSKQHQKQRNMSKQDQKQVTSLKHCSALFAHSPLSIFLESSYLSLDLAL